MPSENGVTSDAPPAVAAGAPVPLDRRARKRAARRDHLLDLAADLVEEVGIEGLTMAALAEAADYATASLYTYFPSRSALLAALQQRALHTLGRVAADAVATWDAELDGARTEPATGALARLVAFSDLFLAAPERHPREFRLQQRLLVTPDAEDSADAAEVVPAAMAVLDVPRRLLVEAVDAGALAEPEPVPDPLGQPVDGALVRTLSWVVALNGALLTDELATGLPVTGADLGRQLTSSLLTGWGAEPSRLATALDLAATWEPR